MHTFAAALVATAVLAAGCGDSDVATDSEAAIDSAAEQRHPDVVAVDAERVADGSWTFRVTLSSPYDTPERYADGWRVVGPDGTVLGVHELAHDHADEQPFTRTQRGVEIPDGVSEVTVEGRDQQYGFGGTAITVTLARD